MGEPEWRIVGWEKCYGSDTPGAGYRDMETGAAFLETGGETP